MVNIQVTLTELKVIKQNIDDILLIVKEVTDLNISDTEKLEKGAASLNGKLGGIFTADSKGEVYVEQYQKFKSMIDKEEKSLREIEEYLPQLITWLENLVSKTDPTQIQTALENANFSFKNTLNKLYQNWLNLKPYLVDVAKESKDLYTKKVTFDEKIQLYNAISKTLEGMKCKNEYANMYKNTSIMFISKIIKENPTSANKIFEGIIILTHRMDTLLNPIKDIKNTKIPKFEDALRIMFVNNILSTLTSYTLVDELIISTFKTISGEAELDFETIIVYLQIED